MKNQKRILLFLTLLILIVFCCNWYLKYQLKNTYSQSVGKVVRLVSGGPSGSLDFRFKENSNSKLNNTITIKWPSCRRIIREEMRTLRQMEFPVVYAQTNLNNAEILIFEDQYERFGVEIPNEIKEIVSKLSTCKD